ncbi:hypothetical protein [Arthrobacter crystallopoietes]|uniref:hypothetical protein n=1 Tax=Crystallibacter crystallopoietes TaxID=37928 RepID=UPI0011114156|nr:hypothetical protein [Arthrobacter crystallopoietes]
MGNLGHYQDITTLAKKLGGVDNLIKTIEVGAAKKALKKTGPVLLGVGALVGAGATKGIDSGMRGWAKYKESQAAAAEAKEQLKSVVEESVKLDDADDRPTGSSDDIGDEN